MKYISDTPRTAMEVFNMLPEGTRCEVIENTLYMSPSPSTDHQKILLKIAGLLSQYVENNALGEIYIAPCDVYLNNENDVVQPDILYVGNSKKELIHKKGIYGSPDLIIEILSSNQEYDTLKKFDLYLKNLIPEYVIINPENKEVLHFVLTDGQYIKIPSETGNINLKGLKTKIIF